MNIGFVGYQKSCLFTEKREEFILELQNQERR